MARGFGDVFCGLSSAAFFAFGCGPRDALTFPDEIGELVFLIRESNGVGSVLEAFGFSNGQLIFGNEPLEARLEDEEGLVLLSLDRRQVERGSHRIDPAQIAQVSLEVDPPGECPEGRLSSDTLHFFAPVPTDARAFRLDRSSLEWRAGRAGDFELLRRAQVGYARGIEPCRIDLERRLTPFGPDQSLLPDGTIILGTPRFRGPDSALVNAEAVTRISPDRVAFVSEKAVLFFERGRPYLDQPGSSLVVAEGLRFGKTAISFTSESGRDHLLVTANRLDDSPYTQLLELEPHSGGYRFFGSHTLEDLRVSRVVRDPAAGIFVGVGDAGVVVSSTAPLGPYRVERTRDEGGFDLTLTGDERTPHLITTAMGAIYLGRVRPDGPFELDRVDLHGPFGEVAEVLSGTARVTARGLELWLVGRAEVPGRPAEVYARDPDGAWQDYPLYAPPELIACGPVEACGQVRLPSMRWVDIDPSSPVDDPKLIIAANQCPFLIAFHPVSGCATALAPDRPTPSSEIRDRFLADGLMTVAGKEGVVVELAFPTE